MDKDSFDTAMKLNHGRTVREGDNVCLKKDNNRDAWFNIISIFPKEEAVYMKKMNSIETLDEYLDNQRHNGSNKRAIRFDEFLISFKNFYDCGRV